MDLANLNSRGWSGVADMIAEAADDADDIIDERLYISITD